LSPLAEAVYEILRSRTGSADPRITYGELAEALREASEDFLHITHRSQSLYAALGEVGNLCRELGFPLLPALVVRADSRRPGEAYFVGTCAGLVYKGEKVDAWRRELEAVKRMTYPAR
jgi:hypothetical protein